MDHDCPYNKLPERAFFRNQVLRSGDLVLDRHADIQLTPNHRVVSAGSCFAARIATFIRESGVNFLSSDDRVTPDENAIREETPNTFSLRYGNIYTVKQLMQLLQRASGTLAVDAPAAVDKNGRLRNLLRPGVLSYSSLDILRADDAAHLQNVRRLLGEADLFIFTLGLTEYWRDLALDLALPSTPGCGYGEYDPARHHFHNASLVEVVNELVQVFALLHGINPAIRVLLTVSPVPLVATYEPMSAIEATFYSKSVLRQAITHAMASWPVKNVDYFPSYEIVTNPHVIAENFESDMRGISAVGVQRVMSNFRARYIAGAGQETPLQMEPLKPLTMAPLGAQEAIDPVCEEENVWLAYLNKQGPSQ